MDYKAAIQKSKKLKVERTVEALKKNHMNAFYVKTSTQAIEIFKLMIEEGDVITAGGSMTAEEIGIINMLKNDNYDYRDRAREGITLDEVQLVQRMAFSADIFVTGTNAVTENGELYNIDGNGNRVAAIAFGPKKVVVFAGINKIVSNEQEARKRVKEISAPANAMRLDCNTPCAVDGICRDCLSEERICCHEVLSGFQRIKNRITVIIIDENFGY